MAWCRGKITRDDKVKALGFGAPTAAPYSDLILRGAGILFFRNFAPSFSVEQVGMEALACFPPNENLFALLPFVRIVFESQMANDTAA